MKSISNKIFLMCSFIPVGLEDYVDFFRLKFRQFIYISMTFPHKKGRIKVKMEEYLDGELLATKEVQLLPSMQNKFAYFALLPINYFLYLLAVFYMQSKSKILQHRKKIRVVYFGINYYCTLIGIFLRLIRRVDYVIYRVMDFFPIPKAGMYRYLNRLFFVIDKFCLNRSDFIMFTTEGHILGREKYGYFDRKYYDYHVIPLGVLKSKIVMEPVEAINQNTLIYCGVVSRYHLLETVLNVVKSIKNKIPDIRFEIIGSGPDVNYFSKFVKDNELDENVTFHGFMPEGEDFTRLMSTATLGIALYRDEEDFMKYTEPAKVKFYLNFGTPVLISDVPLIAKELEKEKVAIIADNNETSIEIQLLDFLQNKQRQAVYKLNINNYLERVYIEALLEEALSVTFDKLEI